MNLERILERLEGVRKTGPDRAVALCPAHQDKYPSLSLREADGKVLIHCFAGCGASAVLDAVGLGLVDLYDRPIEHTTRKQKPNHWHAMREALKTLYVEVAIVLLAAGVIRRGDKLDDVDYERLSLAVYRIRYAAEACK